MAQTKAGGAKTAATNKERYGEDFYQRIGKLSNASWEKNGRKPRGFAANPELASAAGIIGGRKSRRRSKNQGQEQVMKIEVKNKSRKQYIEVKITPEPAFRYEEK